MAFEIEHDWQASLATPKPRIGESAKTRLLLLLTVLWLGFGLIGHDPWKPEEAHAISIVKQLLQDGFWPSPQGALASIPPLYYLSAAASAQLFAPWLALHDAARLATGFWMALTLLMVGMAGREMWGKGEGRQTTLIFLGGIGLFFFSHLLYAEIAGLAGASMAFYGLALAKRRPWRAAALLAAGIDVALLAVGPRMALPAGLTALLLPLCFAHWRRKSCLVSLTTGVLLALPLPVLWAALAGPPAASWLGLSAEWHGPVRNHLPYFLKTASWATWPALPLAAWSLWHFRRQLLGRPQFQLALLYLALTLITLGFGTDNRTPHAMVLLLPLALMGGAAVDHLRRGAASALDWFGIMLFGTLGTLLWLAWFASLSGHPARLAARVQKLSGGSVPPFDGILFVLALALTVVWGLVVFKANKRSNRAAITDWAVGATLVWGLIMTLWLPWLDATRSYHATFLAMRQTFPSGYGCVAGSNVGPAQRALLHYHLDLRLKRAGTPAADACGLLLVMDEKKRRLPPPGADWALLWEGHRPGDRRERLHLYRRVTAHPG